MMLSHRDIGTALSDAGFRPSGFDYLRMGLACLVVFSHAPLASSGMAASNAMWGSPLGGLLKLILPMFFALSGFLVAGSMERCKTAISFAGLRVIRIYPALAVEVLISAIIIGPIVTNVGLLEYFTDPVFWRYMVNVTGHISYNLPGVFVDNPVPHVVNWQLWTVKWELACYIVLIGLIVLGVRKHRWMSLAGLIIFATLCAIDDFRDGNLFFSAVNAHVTGKLLVISFICGVVFYQYREIIPYSPVGAIFAGLLAYIFHSNVIAGDYIAVLPSTYFTVVIGVSNFKRTWFTDLSDSSYGVFLYGFSLQQLVAHVLGGAHAWWLNLIISLPLSILVGAISWNFVEKPIMRRRNIAFLFEERLLSLLPARKLPG